MSRFGFYEAIELMAIDVRVTEDGLDVVLMFDGCVCESCRSPLGYLATGWLHKELSLNSA